MNKYAEFSQVAQNQVLLKKLHSCEQKHYYATEQEARDKWNQIVYKCPYCDGWHRASVISRRKRGLPSLTKGRIPNG